MKGRDFWKWKKKFVKSAWEKWRINFKIFFSFNSPRHRETEPIRPLIIDNTLEQLRAIKIVFNTSPKRGSLLKYIVKIRFHIYCIHYQVRSIDVVSAYENVSLCLWQHISSLSMWQMGLVQSQQFHVLLLERFIEIMFRQQHQTIIIDELWQYLCLIR